MCAKKTDRGPSWFEVGVGAFLSILLGIVAGVVVLAIKPVQKVKELPKDAPSNAVFLIEGVRDASRTSDVAAKRKALTDGESVEFTEGELNVLLSSLTAPQTPPTKPGDKAPAVDPKLLQLGSLNARIDSGHLQLSTTDTLTVSGVALNLVVQASGHFERVGGAFAFVPDRFLVGGCPLERIPVARDVLLRKLLLAYPVPDDLAAAWAKLSDVGVGTTVVKLKMP